MYYTEAEAGSAVVLVHGASTSLLDFHASIADQLSENHRVIAIDRPGHGYSDRPSGDWPDPAEFVWIVLWIGSERWERARLSSQDARCALRMELRHSVPGLQRS